MDAVERSPLPLSSSLHGSLSPSHQRDSERQLPPPSRGKERGGPWTNWTHLAADSASRPNYVLQVLLESRAFDVARKWATVHHLDQKITQQIEVDYLFALLEGASPDPNTAYQLLDGLSDKLLTLRVCQSVLKQCSNLQTTVFILHYMLKRLSPSIHDGKKKDYCNRLLGAKALLCLPEEARGEYSLLISEPLLLVEQLLMDLKLEWVGPVIKHLRQNEYFHNINTSDMPSLDHTPIIISDREASDPFSVLLMFYTAKALEFPQPILTRSTPQVPATPAPMSAFSTRPPSPVGGGGGGVGVGGVTSPTKPIGISYPETPSERNLTSAAMDPSSSSVSSTWSFASFIPRRGSHMPQSSRTTAKFEPPSAPPPREKWIPNSKITRCPICKQVDFGTFNRRHHCRRCGRVVCARCSPHLTSVENYAVPVRVCNDCFDYCTSNSKDSSTTEQEASSYLGSAYPSFNISPLRQWRLIPNDSLFNENARRAFYYEQTPSTTISLSIIDFISDRRVAAAYILDCCHSVSAQLVPDSQGRINEEVDHNFVMGMIQNLLLNAKLRFSEASDLPGVELCDMYLSRMDLLRQLVSSGYSRIPSIQELTKPDLARRVRDRLIQNDRFALAMEVSTKCQLDASAVWSAWGMACLKYGDLSSARTKFKHCFQTGSNYALLCRIQDQIESSPLVVNWKQNQHTEDWSAIVTSMSFSDRKTEGCDLDFVRFSECVFYITTYGTPSHLVSFFVRHNCWLDAAKYIIEQRCHTDVFVDNFLVPALKSGQIEHAEECMKLLDPTLGKWEAYLTAACRYFTQRGLYFVLYRTQLFIRDFFRAGMTCIKFFIGFAGKDTTITQLHSRLHYLYSAKGHFQTVQESLRPQDRTSRGGGLSRTRSLIRGQEETTAKFSKTASVSEIQAHISTIDFQIHITQHLYDSAHSAGTLDRPMLLPHMHSGGREGGVAPTVKQSQQSPQLPATLFSNSLTRGEVVSQVLVFSQDIIEGFELAKNVIHMYRLPVGSIFSNVAQVLAHQHRYGDIRLLIQCVQKSKSLYSNELNDEVIMSAIKVLVSSQSKETKQVDKLVSLLTNDRSKIRALVQCGKLKNAYLTAISSNLVDEVRAISEIAEKAGQLSIRDICEKWLQKR